mgnify:FL=1
MNIPTRSDFDNWRSDPVTRAFFAAARERVEDAKELLSIEAGLNPNQDNLLRGLIQAYREMQDFRMDDLEEVVA